MAGWSAPGTWTVGQVVTAANMNTEVRDNLRYLKGLDGVTALNDGVTVAARISGKDALNLVTSVSANDAMVILERAAAGDAVCGLVDFVDSGPVNDRKIRVQQLRESDIYYHQVKFWNGSNWDQKLLSINHSGEAYLYGGLTMLSGMTVDGVDVSVLNTNEAALNTAYSGHTATKIAASHGASFAGLSRPFDATLATVNGWYTQKISGKVSSGALMVQWDLENINSKGSSGGGVRRTGEATAPYSHLWSGQRSMMICGVGSGDQCDLYSSVTGAINFVLVGQLI